MSEISASGLTASGNRNAAGTGGTGANGNGSKEGLGLAAQTISLLLALLALCTFMGVLLAAFFLPAVTVTSAVAKDGVDLFESLPTELEVAPLNEASRIEAADGSLLATFYSENRIMVPLDQIDEDLQHAVIAIEDRRFYEHNGVDLQGTFRAALTNAAGGDLQGGSSLTQQYVKNALLMDAVQKNDQEAIKEATESSLTRKAREAKLAIALEKQWTKDEILNGYLNIAQFGPSQYGVETAAQHYFSKSAIDLTPGEAALLAGITNSPNNNDPVNNPQNATTRRNEVLADMLELNYITPEDYDLYVNQPVEEQLKVQNIIPGCAVAGGNGFFCDYVTRSLMADPNFAPTYEERQAKLYGGGLTIRTTLDIPKQNAALEIVNRKVPATADHGFGHAIVTVEPGTGKILTMAQNRSFNPYQESGPGETSLNYMVPKHLGGGNGFPVGSTFKVFSLTEYLKEGGSIWDTVPTRRETFNNFPAECLPGGQWYETNGWNPDNVIKNLPARENLADATRLSNNTSFVRIAKSTDLCKIAETARSMGIYPAYYDDSTPEAANAPILDLYPNGLMGPATMAIGEYNVAALDMAGAYATFASGGVYCKPQAITSITDRAGNELPFTGTDCTQVLDKQVADAMAWGLSQNVTERNAPGLVGIGAGKTGTSENQYHTWFAGFTRKHATAVWFGNPSGNIAPGGFEVDGQWLRRNDVWGTTVSLPTWAEYERRISEGLERQPLPGPPPRPAQIRHNFMTDAERQAEEGRNRSQPDEEETPAEEAPSEEVVVEEVVEETEGD